MQRHPPLIEKDIEDDSQFWRAIKNYITPNIFTKLDVENFVTEVEEGEITDISPSEFHVMRQKLANIYQDQKLDDITISYNIFLGQTHYQKLVKKMTNPNFLNF